jgi:predicted unusual protein kinase regulating ubiquinone biosynthesis (AarF/ABC1/UbiB family)|tara:strand:+ start:6883 stop:7398 length:516 start_codon:yes stop_codon:yes gene_type:complete
MEKKDFKALLFDIACTAVTCDGNIDEREIRELEYIEKSTVYFQDVDMSRKLDIFVDNFKQDSDNTSRKIMDKLKSKLLNPVQEMLILEVVIRLIYSDSKIEKKEIEYIKSIRSNLSIDDEMITERFGEINFLLNIKPNIVQIKKESKEQIKSAELENLENMYVKHDGKNDN